MNRLIVSGQRMWIRCVMCVTSMFFATLGCGAEQWDPNQNLVQLMGSLAHRKHGHVAFVERHFLAILDQTMESSGELFYEAPNHLEKRTLKPKPESIVLDSGTLRVRRGNHFHVMSLREYPQIAQFIDSIRATMAGDLVSLNKIYTIGFATSNEGWHLALVPRDAKLAAVIARIRVSGVSDEIRTIEFERRGGDHSVMTISPLPDT
jgi:Outer membrane lipoprotein carrier protein LolA-like